MGSRRGDIGQGRVGPKLSTLSHRRVATPCVRCRVLTGAFTSGNDLTDFQQLNPGPGPSEAVLFLRTLAGAGKSPVAAIEGFAAGVGVTTLLHFDLAPAGRSAQFRMPFADLGSDPGADRAIYFPRLRGSNVRASC